MHKELLVFQRNEITEHFVYLAYARKAQGRNREILEKLAADELRHYHQFFKYTNQELRPIGLKVRFYRLCALIFGLTFGMRLMENGEKRAEMAYSRFGGIMPEIVQIIRDESGHEQALIALITDERLSYMGSMVLALNNSIQEFSGIAVGLTFAMGNAGLIGSTILISGLAATLAMSASEYLSQKAEGAHLAGRSPVKAIAWAGGIYLSVVLMIALPYLLLVNCYAALFTGAAAVLAIIMAFTFYMAVVKGLPYRAVLLETLAVFAVVVGLSSLIGIGAKRVFHPSL
jgi:VIT1/CCC1 family predicted Fe2+/Mn2+ transporter